MEPVMSGTSGYRSIIFNIDLEKRDINDATINSDQHSLIIFVVDNDIATKFYEAMKLHGFKYYCHYLFVSKDIIKERAEIDKLITFVVQYSLDNVVLIDIKRNEKLELSRIIYDQRSAVAIPDFPRKDCRIYDKMFYTYASALKGEDKYVYVLFDSPRGINLTSRNKDGTQMISMGGRDAYLATLIPRRLNITVKLCAISFTADYNENDYEYAYLKEFIEKTFEEDDFITPKLEYESTMINQIYQ